MFEQYADSSLGFTAVRPSGWSELAPGLFARSQLGVVTLLEQMVPGITGDQLVGGAAIVEPWFARVPVVRCFH